MATLSLSRGLDSLTRRHRKANRHRHRPVRLSATPTPSQKELPPPRLRVCANNAQGEGGPANSETSRRWQKAATSTVAHLSASTTKQKRMSEQNGLHHGFFLEGYRRQGHAVRHKPPSNINADTIPPRTRYLQYKNIRIIDKQNREYCPYFTKTLHYLRYNASYGRSLPFPENAAKRHIRQTVTLSAVSRFHASLHPIGTAAGVQASLRTPAPGAFRDTEPLTSEGSVSRGEA